MNSSVVDIRGLGLTFERDGRRTEVLRGLDLAIPRGAFVADYLGELVRGPLADVREAAYGFADGGTYMFRVDVDEEEGLLQHEGEEGEKEKRKENGGGGGGGGGGTTANQNTSSSASALLPPPLPPPPFSGVPVVVDATQTGGAARFINHSCDPNCTTRAHADGGEATVEEFDAETGAKTTRKVSLRLPRVGIVARRDIAAGEELTYDYQFEPEPDEPAIECHCGARECRGRLN